MKNQDHYVLVPGRAIPNTTRETGLPHMEYEAALTQ